MNNEKLWNVNSFFFNLPSTLNFNFFIFNSRREGFTLIETLLSITFTAIILGAVYTSFFTTQRAIERFDEVILKYHESRTALDIMRREIEGAFITNPQAADTMTTMKTAFVIEDRDVFGKSTSRLHLTTFTSRGGGINAISYYVREKDGTLTLFKSVSPALNQSTGKTQTPDREYVTEAIEGIEGFTVETLFNNTWIKTWNTEQTGTLPDIMRISIEFHDKAKKVKLTEFARPKIGKNL